MLYADVTIAESFLIGLVLGAVAGVAGLILAAMVFGEDDAGSKDDAESEDPTPEHECPYCGTILRAVTVACLDDDDDHPIPLEARWICPRSDCEAWWFADRPAAKPAGLEEV